MVTGKYPRTSNHQAWRQIEKDIMLAAYEYLCTHRWIKKTYKRPSGAVCAVGALDAAIWESRDRLDQLDMRGQTELKDRLKKRLAETLSRKSSLPTIPEGFSVRAGTNTYGPYFHVETWNDAPQTKKLHVKNAYKLALAKMGVKLK